MPQPGWVNLSLKKELIDLVDAFIERNKAGYSNRAEVVAAAIRQFFENYDELETLRALREPIGSADPQDVHDAAEALKRRRARRASRRS